MDDGSAKMDDSLNTVINDMLESYDIGQLADSLNNTLDLSDNNQYTEMDQSLPFSRDAEANTDDVMNNNVPEVNMCTSPPSAIMGHNGTSDPPLHNLIPQQELNIYGTDNIQLPYYATNEYHQVTTNSSQDNTTSPIQVCIAPLDPVPSLKEAFMSGPAFTSTDYIPYNTQHNELPQLPPTPTLSNQVIYTELQTNPESAPTVAVNTCSEPLDSMQPTPGMSSAEYLSSVQISPQYPESSGASTIYYRVAEDSLPSTSYAQPTLHQMPRPSNELQQIVPQTGFYHPSVTVPSAASVSEQNNRASTIYYRVAEDSLPSTSYAQPTLLQMPRPSNELQQIVPQTGFFHPSVTVSSAVSVSEQNNPPGNFLQIQNSYGPKIKKKPRKANIHYGTNFYCRECNKNFGKQGNLNQHMRRHHDGPKPFRCGTCGKAYLTEPALRQHVQNHDPSRKPWECSVCENRYRHMKDRDRHYDAHHGRPAYPCPMEGCDRRFPRRDHLLLHLGSHDNRKKREEKKAQEREEKARKMGKRGRKRM